MFFLNVVSDSWEPPATQNTTERDRSGAGSARCEAGGSRGGRERRRVREAGGQTKNIVMMSRAEAEPHDETTLGPKPPNVSSAEETQGDRDYGWETSKENLQPVKVGRSVSALKQATALVSADQVEARQAAKDFDERKR